MDAHTWLFAFVKFNGDKDHSLENKVAEASLLRTITIPLLLRKGTEAQEYVMSRMKNFTTVE